MCGIAGINLAPDENIDAQMLIRTLLLGIEERGQHATGVAYFNGGEAVLTKAAITARKFVQRIGDVPASTTNALLHTRWATQGTRAVNANNHPIDVGGIIGVHNGCCWNDDALFDRIGPELRIAEVDSEAIFATLRHGGERPAQALTRIQGSAAVAWIDSKGGDPAVMHAARVSSSPLVYGFTEAGSFIFASTHRALARGVDSVGLRLSGGPYTMPEGQYLKIRNGEVIGKETFQKTARKQTVQQAALERLALNLG